VKRKRKLPDHFISKLVATIVCLVLVVGVADHYLFAPAYGAQLGYRSMQLSNSEFSVVANYLLKFNLSTAGNLGSITIQFCSNDALIGDVCTVPGGFDDSAAVLSNQTGPTGFTISGASTANEIILTRTPAFAPVETASYTFTGITNPSSSGSYYVRVQTYATDDATGPASDYGGIAIAITDELSISAEVPPYLIFCTGVTITGLNCANAVGNFIDFGELSQSYTSRGSSQMLAATNGEDGYDVVVYGTTMTSGNNIINAIAADDVSRPGTGQFGFNLRANTTPPDGEDPFGPGLGEPTAAYDRPNFYQFNSGDVIISQPVTDNLREYTASYIVNVPGGQAPGIYVSTLTYIATATF
jgi:hypothetical protein